MANFTRDKEHIHKQLALAKETLIKLRALTDSKNTTEGFNGHNGNFSAVNGVNEWDRQESDEGDSSGVGMDSPNFDLQAQETANFASDKSTAARDSLARVLGLQVSKLEDDLRVSLLAYFEHMEQQKEELTSSFETMHAQLLKHQEICQQHRKEDVEKDALIERLKAAKQTLEMDVETLKRENMQLKTASGRTRENGISGYRIKPGFVEPDELSETLMKENSRLREKLRKYESNDYDRLERKVALQEKLCESYNKDMSSKDKLLKRLQAENRGLHEDVKSLQDEVLRVNANRLNAEQDKSRLQQEVQFCEEQINTLREKLSNSAEESRYLQNVISDVNSKANISGDNLSELEKEILALRGKCESYRDKLNDKERFLASVTKENQGLNKAVEAMKRELAAIRGEERSLKVENERLQRENADREIDRLSSETTTEAHSSKISKMKQRLHELQSKVDELERQRRQHDDRETELGQEVLANLEKYTQVEQQLYLTKRELAQVRGFYDSSEEKKRDLQAEVKNSKERIASLERKLQAKQMGDEDELRMSDVKKNNQELNEENQKLRDDFQTSKTEIKELEEALQSAREQNSLQRMRLDAHETLMKRKDERIKELQNEVLELHNQIDNLTDEILKKNRELEGLRMTKMLLDQELDLLKSGRVSARSLHRDGLPFHHTADPASPDSGFCDTEREKAIDRLRREILSQSKFHPQQSVLYEEDLATNGEDKPSADLALQARRLKETEKRLQDVIAENENLKDREQEASSLQLQMDAELRKVKEANKELKEKEKMLTKALEERQNTQSHNEIPQHIAAQLEEEMLLLVEDPVETASLQPSLETSPESGLENLQSKPQESLIDFEDEQDGPNTQPLRDSINQLQNRTQELEGKLHEYEASLAEMAAEKEQLLGELTQTQENLQEIENECRTAQENKEELQQIMQEELSAKDEEVAKLQKELSVLCEEQEGLKAFVNSSKEASSDAEDQLLRAQNVILDYERQKELLRDKEKSLQELLSKSEESNANLQVQLSKTEQQCRNVEQDAKDLQQQILLVQQSSVELEGEVQELQEKLAEAEEKQKIASECLEKSSSLAGEELLKAQSIIQDLERQQEISRDTEKSLQDHLNQSEASNANLQVRLGEAEREHRNKEQESKALQQQIVLVQHGSAEMEREVKELREKIADEEEKREKASERLKELQAQNEELRQKLTDANDALENSLQENQRAVLKLQEDIREKENHIQQLQEELNLSEQRYTEIKCLSGNNQTEISDLQAELIESKEQFYTVSQEKTRLVHSQKDLEQNVAEKAEKISALELEKSEDKRMISEQETKVEELVDKLEDYENENRKLNKENEHFRESLEKAAMTQKEMEGLLEESQEETKALEQQLTAAHESITDLETAFERGEDKNSQIEENLREAKERIAKLEMQLEESQKESRALEKDCKETEKELEKAQASLDSCQEKIATLEKKLRAAEENVSDLEMARDNGLSNEQLLQQRFANAREKIDKTEKENNELKERLSRMEKKLGDILSKQETLEDKKEELDKINNELRHELEYERERRLAFKQKVDAKDRENDVIQRKVQLLEKNKVENEDIQHKDMEEKTKLREELSRAKKTLSELETTKDHQEESINEMEDLLRETRAKIATLEQKLEDSSRDNADLHGQLEELNRKLKYTKEENSELEKRLQKQKEISDEFRNNLAEREETAMNSNYNRDAAERALQSVKKELARKDAKLKMQKEQIDDMEIESEKAGRKLKETENSYKKMCNENERLTKELADIKAKLAKLEAMYKEKTNVPVESEVTVARVSELQSNPVQADKLIRDWSDKLSTAQIKVTDLENDLLRDIKKHEMKVRGTRPMTSQDWRRRSADNLAGYGRPSRTRHRANRSRDSSVESLRSTQSMFDYIDESIVVHDNTGKQESDNVPSADSKERSPVESDNELASGIPVVKIIPSDTVYAPETDTHGARAEGEFSKSLGDVDGEVSDIQSTSPDRDDTPVDWETEDLIDPHIDYQTPFERQSAQSTSTDLTTEDLFDLTRDLPELQIDSHSPLFTESPSDERRSTDLTDPFEVRTRDEPDLQIDHHQQLVTESAPGRNISEYMAENVFDVSTDDAVDQTSHDYQQPLLIEPPSDDLFQFESLPSDNSSLTTVTDLTFRSSSSPVFPEHTLLVTFDPLDATESHTQNKNDEEFLDPFEELMKMEEAQQGYSKETDINDLDDVIIDVTDDVIIEANDDAIFDFTDATHDNVDGVDNGVSDTRPTSIPSKYHVTDEAGGDVIDLPEQIAPVPYNQKETMRDLGPGKSEQTRAPSIDHVTRGAGIDVIDSPEQIAPVPYSQKETMRSLGPGDSEQTKAAADIDHVTQGGASDVSDPPERIEPVPRPRKIKDKFKPALWSRGSKKEKNENDKKKKDKSDVEPYSVMIMVDDKIVQPDNNLHVNPDHGEKKKQKGTRPASLALEEEEEEYKSPSQIRRELEEASKESQQKQIPQVTKRTHKELKQNPEKERKQKPDVPESRTAQYHIEEKNRRENANVNDSTDRGGEGEQEEAMGRGRLQKLIAAFNK
ncbi:uncharacterized protein LOC144664605 [Oculina patagonica]